MKSTARFLFEGDEGNVLYTGDFRLAKGEAARMVPLHSGNRIKDIKSVYVDTTFCVPEAMYIPSREQSRDALLNLVEKQIQKSPTHMVRLACKAKYGYEYLFVEISKEFNLKVHVSAVVMAQYKRVPELAKHLTTDGKSTQVHACRYVDCSMPTATDVLVVVPSTMWFTSNARPSDVLKKVRHRYRLCFSFHSSFSEVRDFLRHIHPINIYANVIPYDCTEEVINERLQDLRRDTETPKRPQHSPGYRPLGQLKKSARAARRKMTASCSADGMDDELSEWFQSSPPLNKRRKEQNLQGECSSYVPATEDVRTSPESGDHPKGSIQDSYLAMDDSDLSSGELDLYDSAPDQSLPVEDSQEGFKEQNLEFGEVVEPPSKSKPPHKLHDNPATCKSSQDEDYLQEVVDLNEKRSRQESKHAEINSWLKYLPDADIDKESQKAVRLGTATPPPVEEKHPPADVGLAETDCRVDVKLPDGVHHLEAKHQGMTELDSSWCESDVTEEYSIKNSQETSVPVANWTGTSQNIPQYLEDGCCKPTWFDARTADASKQQDKSDSTGFTEQRGTQQHAQNTNKLPADTDGNVIESKSHGTVVLSSQLSSTGSVVPLESSDSQATLDEAHLELSQGTNHSQDTFLPSSQGSAASRSSSDFDIPCTPEGKGVRPDRVEAVWVRIARGESVGVASCNRSIKPD
ncbi:protein artemis-like isoform X2 [Acanthaster planci]|uniref:Protein artemis n=1 Tax=Acanthaster planci TaxID=133434 RepID=A0A8B7Z633_ACAPL|nr:protein artemis-like isoform X2 [Acanthaster planci]